MFIKNISTKYKSKKNNNTYFQELIKLIDNIKLKIKKKKYFIFSVLNYEYYTSFSKLQRDKLVELDFIIEDFQYLDYEYNEFKNELLNYLDLSIHSRQTTNNAINIFEQRNNNNNYTKNILNLQLNIHQLHIEFLINCLNFELSENINFVFDKLYRNRIDYLDYLVDIENDVNSVECQLVYDYKIKYKNLKLGELHLLTCDNFQKSYKNDETILNKTLRIKHKFYMLKEKLQKFDLKL